MRKKSWKKSAVDSGVKNWPLSWVQVSKHVILYFLWQCHLKLFIKMLNMILHIRRWCGQKYTAKHIERIQVSKRADSIQSFFLALFLRMRPLSLRSLERTLFWVEISQKSICRRKISIYGAINHKSRTKYDFQITWYRPKK